MSDIYPCVVRVVNVEAPVDGVGNTIFIVLENGKYIRRTFDNASLILGLRNDKTGNPILHSHVEIIGELEDGDFNFNYLATSDELAYIFEGVADLEIEKSKRRVEYFTDMDLYRVDFSQYINGEWSSVSS